MNLSEKLKVIKTSAKTNPLRLSEQSSRRMSLQQRQKSQMKKFFKLLKTPSKKREELNDELSKNLDRLSQEKNRNQSTSTLRIEFKEELYKVDPEELECQFQNQLLSELVQENQMLEERLRWKEQEV